LEIGISFGVENHAARHRAAHRTLSA